MNDFIESLGWGSTFMLIWLLLLTDLSLSLGTIAALVFFFLVGVLATASKGMNEKVMNEKSPKSKKEA